MTQLKQKCYVTPAFSGVPNKGDKIRSQNLRRGHHDAPRNKAWIQRLSPVSSIAPEGWGPKEGVNVVHAAVTGAPCYYNQRAVAKCITWWDSLKAFAILPHVA